MNAGLITILVDNRPVQVSPADFGKYRSVIIDGINAQIKYVYNRAKEKFTTASSTNVKVGKYTVQTNLASGLAFSPDGDVEINDSAFHDVLRRLFSDVASLMLTYNRPDEFLSMIQTPELWAMLVFVGADEELTDLFIKAELAFFDATWGKSKDVKEVEMRKSIIDMLLSLKNGKSYDLSNLKLVDSDGKPVKINGTVTPC
ncbi:MAG: hypothetical protein ACP5RE_03450 [Candidatus Acidifodinimicrobium sp.]